MSATLRKSMTRDAFFAWVQAQEEPYEFDGFEPVAMTGGTNAHGMIADTIRFELRNRSSGSACRPLGSDGGGIATIGDAVRYPDAAVTCSPIDGGSRLLPDPVVVFEVVSASSVRTDRVLKLREYQAVPSIRHYVIVEPDAIAVTVFSRSAPGAPFIAAGLLEEDTIELPEIGIAIPVGALYAGVATTGSTVRA